MGSGNTPLVKMGMNLKLIHQTQPTERSCTATALAIVLNQEVSFVISMYGEMIPHHLWDDIFWEHGIKAEYVHGYSIESGYVYVIDVPSLQEKAAFHKVVLDFREPNRVELFDPMEGRGECYTHDMLMEGRLPFGNAIKLKNYEANFNAPEN